MTRISIYFIYFIIWSIQHLPFKNCLLFYSVSLRHIGISLFLYFFISLFERDIAIPPSKKVNCFYLPLHANRIFVVLFNHISITTHKIGRENKFCVSRVCISYLLLILYSSPSPYNIIIFYCKKLRFLQ